MGIALVVVCLLLIWRHRSNIANLLAGKESRIGAKKVVQSIQSEEGQT
jgi:glycerol-3-phosphate acyltransferase PlsY